MISISSEKVQDFHVFMLFGLKNVFPTVKILTFSRGEFKYVQMDQGLSICGK
jgi:hypothetical protein